MGTSEVGLEVGREEPGIPCWIARAGIGGVGTEELKGEVAENEEVGWDIEERGTRESAGGGTNEGIEDTISMSVAAVVGRGREVGLAVVSGAGKVIKN